MFNHLFHMKILGGKKDEGWERTLDQTLDFHIRSICFGRTRRLSICQEQELSWMPPRRGGTGADHQRFSATMLRRHGEMKAQSCSRDALLLRFNVAAAAQPAAWRQHKHGRDPWRVAVPGDGPYWWSYWRQITPHCNNNLYYIFNGNVNFIIAANMLSG